MLLYDGSRVTVEKVTLEHLDNPVEIFNFEVADWHTYHVGLSGVLVHNKCDVNAGKPGSPEWKKAVKAIREGNGKGINANVETEAQARQLINEARPELKEFKKYTRGAQPGFELHDIEPGINKDLPHIEWQDWTLKKAGGAEGHIFIFGKKS